MLYAAISGNPTGIETKTLSGKISGAMVRRAALMLGLIRPRLLDTTFPLRLFKSFQSFNRCAHQLLRPIPNVPIVQPLRFVQDV
jgi:hypothetical protein